MNISNVAKIAGVSNATVSRVMRGSPNVKPATVMRVKNAIKYLGYTPKTRNRRPAGKGSKSCFPKGLVGVVVYPDSVGETSSPIQIAVISSIEKKLRDQGASMIHSQIIDSLPPLIDRGLIDAMIAVYWPTSLINRFEDVLRHQILTVFVGTESADQWGDHIHSNNKSIGILAAQYLLTKGCRKLCYIGYKGHSANIDRHKGFADTVKSDKRDLMAFALPDLYNLDEMTSVVERMCQEGLPDGIFVFDDNWLSKLYPLFQQKFGPRFYDIRLIGCNNEEAYLSGLHPQPATIDINPRIIAEHAVRQLKWRCENRSDPSQTIIRIEPTLVLPNNER
ncbi:MAG TPA: LacI family DNA-binding transcriptional regulator [Anaerohalosphaeraceae bacterium]|nr:LacI family DNA-binding transcriptional regulator [Phycisphaerae bacterium]HOK95423.1 LacI family DNA-binding transcriptional regulator [Anaerohalosphaeraceae bacterium]HOL32073.1 LacI family DNA-binding transcriptional regulator [Anaerohalosphaeraceae bacterium]HOM75964.1 LacI family DNA-binding transcriptional regulator [Anaerohalosphaeraceae bacterium]HPC62994.1 LacI family DNA-binding transcriptional regulator [Anaerohalosphaeraceae bacterium]